MTAGWGRCRLRELHCLWVALQRCNAHAYQGLCPTHFLQSRVSYFSCCEPGAGCQAEARLCRCARQPHRPRVSPATEPSVASDPASAAAVADRCCCRCCGEDHRRPCGHKKAAGGRRHADVCSPWRMPPSPAQRPPRASICGASWPPAPLLRATDWSAADLFARSSDQVGVLYGLVTCKHISRSLHAFVSSSTTV